MKEDSIVRNGERYEAGSLASGEVDGGFGFDDEEGVGVGAAGCTEFLAGFVEGIGEDGEYDTTVGAANEIEAALLLDELELDRHS